MAGGKEVTANSNTSCDSRQFQMTAVYHTFLIALSLVASQVRAFLTLIYTYSLTDSKRIIGLYFVTGLQVTYSKLVKLLTVSL